MSAATKRAASRWTDESMTRRVRRRYLSERLFRGAGLLAISLSVAFLAFLLWNMGSKGLGGFSQYQAALPIDFTKSDLFLDPATLRGSDAAQTVAGADLEGTISKAATAAYGPSAERMFGDAAVARLSEEIVANPDVLKGQAMFWLPVSSKVDIAAKDQSDSASEQLVDQVQRARLLAERLAPPVQFDVSLLELFDRRRDLRLHCGRAAVRLPGVLERVRRLALQRNQPLRVRLRGTRA